MNLCKAAEMALETLCVAANDAVPNDIDERFEQAIQALRQALAQPEQEPVAYVTIENISSWAQVPSIKWFKKPTEGPLYTAPPKCTWVGLTRLELDIATLGLEDLSDCYKAIEAKLKEKNA